MGAVEEWIAAHPRVDADRTVMAAPEVWEGTIDRRSFYSRERHGSWHIEIDLVPDGRFANRYVGVSDDGQTLTEPVELTSATSSPRVASLPWATVPWTI